MNKIHESASKKLFCHQISQNNENIPPPHNSICTEKAESFILWKRFPNQYNYNPETSTADNKHAELSLKAHVWRHLILLVCHLLQYHV